LVFKRHRVFKGPEDENAKIWRYIDFTKYVSLLDTKSLYFARVDRLDDKFEGSVPNSFYPSTSPETIELMKEYFPDSYQSYIKESGNELKQNKKASTINMARRRWTFVNCWHMNEVESAAMWKLYLKSNEGVAVQTTYKFLCESFCKSEYDEWIGLVKYIDYSKDKMPSDNSNYRFVYKRKSYDYEKELRAVIRKYPISEKDLKSGSISLEKLAEVGVYPEGQQIPVDLETLVQRVYVSPYAEEWFASLVLSITEKYKLEKNVTKSSLSDDPVY
jgi:hypothetical protein